MFASRCRTTSVAGSKYRNACLPSGAVRKPACSRSSLPKSSSLNPQRKTAKCLSLPRHTAHKRSAIIPAAVSPAEVQQATTAPALEVEVDAYTVSKNVTLIRSSYKYRLKYEVEYNLRRGTSDNSYLLTYPEHNTAALIDVPYEVYKDDFLNCLDGLLDAGLLSHIILTHLDPKALPTLVALLQRVTAARPKDMPLNMVLTNPALQLLEKALEENPASGALLQKVKVTVLKSGGVLPLAGDSSVGPSLEVMLTPTPRWPDLMALYDRDAQIMFTGKLFSAHVYVENHATDVGGWEKYSEDWRYFFECMLAPSASQVTSALDKLDMAVVKAAAGQVDVTSSGDGISIWNVLGTISQKVKELSSGALVGSFESMSSMEDVAARVVGFLAPMHGPVVKSALSQLLVEYREWTKEQIKAAELCSITVMYASAYGNTAALAQAIGHGMTKAGVAVKTVNLEIASLEEVAASINSSDAFILGSPTLGGHMPTQVQIALGAVIREPKSKSLPCGVFGSFGWSGEAIDEMEGRLRDAGFKFAFDPIRVKFKPTSKDLQLCEQSGRDLAVLAKKKKKSMQTSVSGSSNVKVGAASGPTLAIGRLVGSLCVVTAADEDATSAMLASWVTQASFDPPGLTISVKKDRAMEQLLVPGSKFSLSMIPEGPEEKLLVKKLSTPFTPTQDRLAGLPTQVSEVTGAAILTNCCAALDCAVLSRMEAGDHWLLYASVLNGKVLNDKQQTAVHFRKVGNHY